jgi:hypothetical protein
MLTRPLLKSPKLRFARFVRLQMLSNDQLKGDINGDRSRQERERKREKCKMRRKKT